MEVHEIKLDDIVVKDRFRKDMGGLEGLGDSIRAKGVIQPITIDAETMQLIAGGRRLAASRLIGNETIPCLMRDIEDKMDALEIELFENKNRKDMTWVEEVKLTAAIHAHMKETNGSWGQRKTAKLLDVSQPRIAQRLSMNEAITIVPELEECANEDEAKRKLKKIMERSIVQEALEEIRVEQKAEAKLAKSSVKWADDSYIVGDATELIKKIESKTADFAEVDPPYAIDLHAQKSSGSAGLKHYTEIPKQDYKRFVLDMSKEVFRVMSEDAWCVWWFGTSWYQEVYQALLRAGFKVDPIPGIWYKEDSSTVTNAPNFYLSRSYETFFVCRKGQPELRKRGRRNLFSFKAVNAKSKRHPTERPVELIEEILDTFAYPGSTICVPFLGSGATLIAAFRQGCKAYGWDISEEFKEGFLIEALMTMEAEQGRRNDLEAKTAVNKEADEREIEAKEFRKHGRRLSHHKYPSPDESFGEANATGRSKKR